MKKHSCVQISFQPLVWLWKIFFALSEPLPSPVKEKVVVVNVRWGDMCSTKYRAWLVMCSVLSIITATNSKEVGDYLSGHHFKLNLEELIYRTSETQWPHYLPSVPGTQEKQYPLWERNMQSRLKWQIISFSPKTYLSNSRETEKA